MAIHVRCEKCGAGFIAQDKYAGRKTACPRCGNALSIPQNSPPTVVEAESVATTTPPQEPAAETPRGAVPPWLPGSEPPPLPCEVERTVQWKMIAKLSVSYAAFGILLFHSCRITPGFFTRFAVLFVPLGLALLSVYVSVTRGLGGIRERLPVSLRKRTEEFRSPVAAVILLGTGVACVILVSVFDEPTKLIGLALFVIIGAPIGALIYVCTNPPSSVRKRLPQTLFRSVPASVVAGLTTFAALGLVTVLNPRGGAIAFGVVMGILIEVSLLFVSCRLFGVAILWRSALVVVILGSVFGAFMGFVIGLMFAPSPAASVAIGVPLGFYCYAVTVRSYLKIKGTQAVLITLCWYSMLLAILLAGLFLVVPLWKSVVQ